MKLNAAGVGIRIRQARVAKGWTQTELAESLGVQRSSVGRWETGCSVPSCIPKIAQVLGHDADWFLAKADEVTLPAAGDSRELKLLREEMRRMNGRLKERAAKPLKKAKSAPMVAAESASTRPILMTQSFKDHVVLTDVLSAWNRVNPETRLMVALLITGDWSYKLKLWNKNVAIAEDVLKAIGTAHRINGKR